MKWRYLFVLVGVLVSSENPEENIGVDDSDLFEGDMRLTAEQRKAAELGLDVDNPLGRGSVINRRWPKGEMAYVIDSRLSGDSRAMRAIRDGMREWTSKTCITFKERTTESAYANFVFGSGCSSYVGRTGRSQKITLARGCWTRGIVAHEIGHALGFYHEQSRPDRDTYVTILTENIKERNKHNFKKYSRSTIDSLGTKYDYGSVMHYRATSFSKNGKPTIVAKQQGVTLGQRRGISAIDAQQMNLLYKCSGGGGGGGGPPPPTPPPPTPPPPPPTPGGNCKDEHPACPHWTSLCGRHSIVTKLCKKSCNTC